MEVFHRLEQLASRPGRNAVAIGNFDGVHRGHTTLLLRVLQVAREEGAAPTVLTFFPHPVEVLNPQKKLERLTTTEEKLALLDSLGVANVLVEKFDRELAAEPPEAFFDRYLVKGLRAVSVHVGFNFMFGRGRQGNTQVLAGLCAKGGIRLCVEEPFELNGVKVDSSTIRRLVMEGDIRKAAEFLGRPFAITGTVAHGDHRGTKLGFPTANVTFPDDKVLPANGVYVTRVRWQRQTFLSVADVGVRPTVEAGKAARRVEVHILDFNSRLYDEWLHVEFLERIRDERKFPSLEALKAQIQADVDFARRSPWH